ncbi:MAG: hypothetical protein JNM56_14545 [Planctomycetia bacterium]|nr:hypothetical protein [Planctomycetia bacterium]
MILRRASAVNGTSAAGLTSRLRDGTPHQKEESHLPGEAGGCEGDP